MRPRAPSGSDNSGDPAAVPDVRTALPGPAGQAIIDRDLAVTSGSLPRAYPLVPRRGTRLGRRGRRRQPVPRLQRGDRGDVHRALPPARGGGGDRAGRRAAALLGQRLLPADLLADVRGARRDRPDRRPGPGVPDQLRGRGGGGRAQAGQVRDRAAVRDQLLRRVPRALLRRDDADRVEGQVPPGVRAAGARRTARAVRVQPGRPGHRRAVATIRRRRSPTWRTCCSGTRWRRPRSRPSSSSRCRARAGTSCRPPPGCARLRALCDKHGILLVADEVQSGMGRTGRMWAIEHSGVQPDILISAKGIASGLPLGAFMARAPLMEKWGAGAHGSTYGGSPRAVRRRARHPGGHRVRGAARATRPRSGRCCSTGCASWARRTRRRSPTCAASG